MYWRDAFRKGFRMFTKSAIVTVATVLAFSSPSWAGDSFTPESASSKTSSAPLAPGQAAGIKRAEDTATDNTLLAIGGLAVLGTGIALLVSNNGNHSGSTTTTTTTTTSTSTTGTN